MHHAGNNFAAPYASTLLCVPASCLQGHAGCVYEHVLGEDKYTFVEDVKHPHSCTILIKGPNDHTIAQVWGCCHQLICSWGPAPPCMLSTCCSVCALQQQSRSTLKLAVNTCQNLVGFSSVCKPAGVPMLLPCVLQIKDAVRDGLRAVKNVIDDKAVVLGAGAFEVAAAQHLRETVKKQVRKPFRLGRLCHTWQTALLLLVCCRCACVVCECSSQQQQTVTWLCCAVVCCAGARQGQAGCGGVCRGAAGLCQDPGRKQRVGDGLARLGFSGSLISRRQEQLLQ